MANKPVGTLGVIDTVTVGGRVLTDTTNLIVLVARVNNGYTTLAKADGSAGYTPSGATAFKVKAVRVIVTTASAGESITLGYGNTDVGQATAGSAPTTPKYPGNNSSAGALVSATSLGVIETISDFTIPNGKYPFIQAGTSGVAIVTVFGYEV